MAITYHSGRRIQATQADFDGTPAVSGGWKELGRTTLSGNSDTIDVTSLADKRYYMLLTDNRPSGNLNVGHRAGNGSLDTGSNYAKRPSINGASDLTHTSQNNFLEDALNHSHNMFSVNYLSNLASKEKLGLGHCVRQNTAGAGNAPNRTEYVGKWANTSNVIDTLATVNFGTGDLASGSELVVLGWDESDTHTDNFWEQLASVDLSGGSADLLSSGSFSAKKYLWCQVYIKPTGTVDIDVTFNNDTGSNYARRNNWNGGTDSTNTSQSNLQWSNNVIVPQFMNCFIINNSANEKLSIMEQVRQGTAGAGNAPDRYHISGKWANTSSQITEIDITNGESGSYDTDSFIKVWGSN